MPLSTKGKDPLVEALKKIEGFAPVGSERAEMLTSNRAWKGAVRNLQGIARKALREAGEIE